MSRPRLDLQNHAEFYKYYGENVPDERLLKVVHAVSSILFHPRVTFAEGARDAIDGLVETDHRFIIACNHLKKRDQFYPASAIKKEKIFGPIVGHTIIPAKIPYFQRPHVRAALDRAGAIPVIRRQDVQDASRTQGEAAISFSRAATKHLIDGDSMFLFPEGTRKKDETVNMGELKGTIGRIACDASAEVPVAIVTMTIGYGENIFTKWVRPDLYISSPVQGPFEDKRQVVANIGQGLAEGLQFIDELHSRR